MTNYDFTQDIKSLTKEDFFETPKEGDKKGGEKFILPSPVIADILVKRRTFSYLRIYVNTKTIFRYLVKEHFYATISEEELEIVVNKTLAKAQVPVSYRSHIFLRNIYGCLLIHEAITFEREPRFHIEQEYISVKKGLLNVHTGEISPHDPSKFIISRFPYVYNSQCPREVFINFLNHISDGNQDKENFFRTVL